MIRLLILLRKLFMAEVIFEKSVPGRVTDFVSPPLEEIKEADSFFPKEFLREGLNLPSLGEVDVVRHYTTLSQKNFSVDTNFYPLGSCTMKYNPKVNEEIAEWPEFANLHPYQPLNYLQGTLHIIYSLEKILCEITGMRRMSFQPAAGAHGELTGMLMVKAYYKKNKQRRNKVIIPDSAHGTNPASAAMCGFDVVEVKSTSEGLLDLKVLEEVVDEHTAGLMLTNPNTLGLFEEDIIKVSKLIHERGAFMYYDGANFNALMGITTPSLMGFDVIHLNLHKTFSTPHGSGGPGAAAIGVSDKLVDFLPTPLVDKNNRGYYLNYRLKHSIGRVKAFYGNFSVLLKAYAYLRRLGAEGIKRVAQHAVLNANYLRKKLEGVYDIASPRPCMHEFVISCRRQKEEYGIGAVNIAKRLIDFGIHPPTMYFPLIVKEALMIEPTETESRKTLDNFIRVMIKINEEAKNEPEKLRRAPLTTHIGHPDEVKAARYPDIRWKGSAT